MAPEFSVDYKSFGDQEGRPDILHQMEQVVVHNERPDLFRLQKAAGSLFQGPEIFSP